MTRFQLILVGIITTVLLSGILLAILKYDNKHKDEIKEQCEEHGGTYFLNPALAPLTSGSCYGEDSEGIRYYWHKDYNGVWYKTK